MTALNIDPDLIAEDDDLHGFEPDAGGPGGCSCGEDVSVSAGEPFGFGAKQCLACGAVYG